MRKNYPPQDDFNRPVFQCDDPPLGSQDSSEPGRIDRPGSR